jgi:hypothetical protein
VSCPGDFVSGAPPPTARLTLDLADWLGLSRVDYCFHYHRDSSLVLHKCGFFGLPHKLCPFLPVCRKDLARNTQAFALLPLRVPDPRFSRVGLLLLPIGVILSAAKDLSSPLPLPFAVILSPYARSADG